VAGTVTLAGWSNRPSPAHFAALQAAAGALFPGAFDGAKAETWSGLRPLTPDQVPIIGGTRIGNLFINSGHGSLGWTLACGAGKLLADIVCRRPADIDLKGLDAARFSF
jgi:D-amino-acid dehydrogenase